MGRVLLAALVLVIVAALLGLYVWHVRVPEQCPAMVDVLEGRAEIASRGRGDPTPLSLGQTAGPGDLLVTSVGSLVELRWTGDEAGTRVKVGPRTRCHIVRAVRRGRDGVSETRLRVDIGRIWVRIRGQLPPGSTFEVETPTSTLAVSGTVFSVAVDDSEATRVEVFEGSVAVVGKDGAGGTLTAKSVTAITPDQIALDIEPLTAANLAEWEKQTSMVGPFLAVESPVDGVLVETGSCIVSGRVESGAQVFLNAGPVEVSQDGRFLVAAALEAGGNTLVVTARDSGGRETMVVRTVPRAAIVD